MLEIKSYNVKELCQVIGISKKTFTNNRERILDQLCDCCDVEIIYTKTGRISKINIKDIYQNYVYERKSNPQRKEKKRKGYYSAIVTTICGGDVPVNEDNKLDYNEPILATAQLVADNLYEHYLDYVKEYHRNYKPTDKAVYQQVLKYFKMMFGKNTNDGNAIEYNEEDLTRIGYIKGRVWCMKHNEDDYVYYKRLDNKQLKELRELFKKWVHNNSVKNTALDELYEKYELKEITEKEYKDSISELHFNCYNEAKKEFKEKYGHRPVLAYDLELYNKIVDFI